MNTPKKNKKTVRFAPNIRRVFYDPEKTGIQRFRIIENTKTASVNDASIYGPWKKPKTPVRNLQQQQQRMYTVNNNGRIIRTTEPGGLSLANILYYRDQMAELLRKKPKIKMNFEALHRAKYGA